MFKFISNRIKGISDGIKEKIQSEKSVSAWSMYSIAKYGKVYSKSQIFELYCNRINCLIRSKSESVDPQFCAAFDVDEDLKFILDDIINKYKSMGFYVKVLSEDTEEGLSGKYVFLSWRKRLDSIVDEE